MDFTFKNLESPHMDLETIITYIVWLLLLGFAYILNKTCRWKLAANIIFV